MSVQSPLRRRLAAITGGVALALGAALAVPTAAHASPDYGPAAWVPASTSNYTDANRESDYNINYVVIHTVQGSYSSAINWFQNPSAQVSAHYVVSKTGAVTQMVRESDIAWHAGNWTYNTQSIGIEHEGYVEQDGWYTEQMYQASAAIVRSVTSKYGIPRDRAHIIGHNEVPGATHTDPGSKWNWTYFMQLVNGTTPPAWSQTVDNSTAGRFTASANWSTSTYSTQRYGADYRYANPQAISDAAWYKFNIPATASYKVEVWYPALPGYNDSTPYVVVTTGGNQSVVVNQQVTGGSWRTLGTFTLAAGDYNAVGVSRWTNGTGYVIADAVRLTRV
ncbi:N-acetylmuramoyl-L-alanine amidase [Catellatospora sp. KI3]|uniref:golvesin C-terminal-like domain-containing protein n=1 Tax=Catellatospora sp. KI3 TaxID=3041620 RepID=UPI0024825BC5|nr:N-acetylmuramoyl-L-alanine amidase [Catellatospora sp. KI3]MDI1463471.1 N-acetylmuramoyl-L-alanine amidase [Catellatospora sp. KI3]